MGIARANCNVFLPESWCLLKAIGYLFICCLASFLICTLQISLLYYLFFYGYILLWTSEFHCVARLSVYIILHCFSFPICLCVRMPLDRIHCWRILNHLSQAVNDFTLFLETSAPLSIDKVWGFFHHLICKSLYCTERPGLGLNNTFDMSFILHFLYCEV